MKQSPTHGVLAGYDDAQAIIRHPALRLGFLDAQAGRPLNHDRIIDRMAKETPLMAMAEWISVFRDRNVELAQYRYEEGRALVTDVGLRCRSWSDPRFPPVQVRRFVERLRA